MEYRIQLEDDECVMSVSCVVVEFAMMMMMMMLYV